MSHSLVLLQTVFWTNLIVSLMFHWTAEIIIEQLYHSDNHPRDSVACEYISQAFTMNAYVTWVELNSQEAMFTLRLKCFSTQLIIGVVWTKDILSKSVIVLSRSEINKISFDKSPCSKSSMLVFEQVDLRRKNLTFFPKWKLPCENLSKKTCSSVTGFSVGRKHFLRPPRK